MGTKRRLVVCSVAAGLLVMVTGTAWAGGGGGGGGGHCSGFGEGTTIWMRDSCYEGVAQFVPVGSTLRVVNEGEVPHSLTAVDGAFDTGTLQPGQEAELTVGEAGVIRYYCLLHGSAQGGGMAGVLIVGDAGRSVASVARPSWTAVLGWLGGGLGGAALALLAIRFRPR
jgi:hypothetical protein